MLALDIPGPPIAWARAGSSGARRFTRSKQAGYMVAVATIARAAMARGKLAPMTGPVEVIYRATFAPPKRTPGERWRGCAPDIDNLVKVLLDGLNKIVFADDAQVASLVAQKRYGLPEGVVVTITPIGEGA